MRLAVGLGGKSVGRSVKGGAGWWRRRERLWGAMLGRRAARQARRQMARLWAQWLAGWGSAGLGSAGGLGVATGGLA